MLLGEVEPVLVEQPPDEVHVRARRVLHVVDGQCDLGGLDELADPRVVGPEHERRAVVVQGVREHRPIPGLPGDRDRAAGEVHGAHGVVGEQGELGFVAQGHREQARVAGIGQHGGCLTSGCLRVGATTAEPQEAREPAQARAEPTLVAELPAQRDGLGLRDHRVAARADRVRLDGELLPQVGPLERLEAVGVVERRTVVRRGLAVRARRGGIPRRARRPLRDGVDVAGGERMVHEPRRVGDARGHQRGERVAFELDAPRRGERVDDRSAGEFVAEPDPVGADGEQAALLRGAERALRARHEPGEQVAVDRRGHDGELLDVVLRRGIQPPESPGHRIDDRRRNPRLVGGGDELADEVRVPLGHPVDPVGVEPAVGRERADRRRRQVRQRDAVDPVAVAQVAEEAAQRMVAVELVAIREDEHRGQVVDPAGEEPEHVERGLVGPVHVLHDEHGAVRVGELVTERGVDLLAVARAQGVAQPGPTAGARSRSGPSVRGVDIASHEPTSTLTPSGGSARRAFTRLVLPMPASPWSSTTRPRTGRRLLHRGAELVELGIALEEGPAHRASMARTEPVLQPGAP